MRTLRDTRPLYLVGAMQVAILALVAVALALVWGVACRSARALAAAPPQA